MTLWLSGFIGALGFVSALEKKWIRVLLYACLSVSQAYALDCANPYYKGEGVCANNEQPVCITETVPTGDGCNTCRRQRCHDKGKKYQWVELVESCTALFCSNGNTVPYDSRDWK
jgi:hypothetical protein